MGKVVGFSNPVPVATEYGAAGNSEIQMPVVSFKLVAGTLTKR